MIMTTLRYKWNEVLCCHPVTDAVVSRLVDSPHVAEESGRVLESGIQYGRDE